MLRTVVCGQNVEVYFLLPVMLQLLLLCHFFLYSEHLLGMVYLFKFTIDNRLYLIKSTMKINCFCLNWQILYNSTQIYLLFLQKINQYISLFFIITCKCAFRDETSFSSARFLKCVVELHL